MPKPTKKVLTPRPPQPPKKPKEQIKADLAAAKTLADLKAVLLDML